MNIYILILQIQVLKYILEYRIIQLTNYTFSPQLEPSTSFRYCNGEWIYLGDSLAPTTSICYRIENNFYRMTNNDIRNSHLYKILNITYTANDYGIDGYVIIKINYISKGCEEITSMTLCNNMPGCYACLENNGYNTNYRNEIQSFTCHNFTADRRCSKHNKSIRVTINVIILIISILL